MQSCSTIPGEILITPSLYSARNQQDVTQAGQFTAPTANQPHPVTPMTATTTEGEWELFKAQRCSHCGGAHARACPRVKRMEWHPNGQLAAVEFWPDGK